MDVNFLPWLIPAGPLLAFAIITLITSRSKLVPAVAGEYADHHHPVYEGIEVGVDTNRGRVVSIVVGMTGMIWALMMGIVVVLQALFVGTGNLGKTTVFNDSFGWMATGTSQFMMGVLVDPLTTIMLVMVPIAATCIFVYSIGYMANDPRQARFFSLISLFAGAMLTLVVADNLLLLFVGWEVMGLCSYMLIGFWFEKESAYKAAIKAFTVTRIADVLMLVGIAYLYFETGTLSFREILYNEEVLSQLATTPAIIFGGSAAAIIGVLLIIGTIGKSAQFPLHVWLPDAMEGPTPVSAMIHAAAMVSAGVYSIIRVYPILEAGGHVHDGEFTAPLLLMAVIGSVTALGAATIAVAQNDVKRVLAYSTISQLGFMVAALGIGAYIAAAFHLITHAFFKALLFMASGAVIHGMEHGEHHVHEHAHNGHNGHDEHDEHAEEADHTETQAHDAHGSEHDEEHSHFDPQDMMNMGGLRHTMPVTFYTFLIGGLSLAGFPLLTAGFWSKDEILADAWLGTAQGFGPHALVFFLLAIAAFLTAFYTTRQVGLTFWGEPRTEEAKHANLGPGNGIIAITMTAPLVVLAFLAIVAGFVGVPPDFPIFGAIFSGGGVNPFFEFVKYTLLPEIQPAKPPFNWIPVLTSFVVALGGIYVGYLLYWRKPLEKGEEDPLVSILGKPIYPLLQNKYYFDELYAILFVRPSQWFSRVVVSQILDRGIIDGFLHLVARVFNWIGDLLKVLNSWFIDGVGDGIPELIQDFGAWFRRLQTGRIQQYLLLIMAAALIIALIFVVSTSILQAGV